LLKYFLFFPILLWANDLFVLPQEADYFLHSYTKDLSNAQDEVYLFSKTIDDYSVIKSLKKLSKKDIKIYIISKDIYAEKNKVSYLNLLKNVQVYTLNGSQKKDIKGSFTCIDDKLSYLSTQDLEHKALNQNHSFVHVQKGPCKSVFTRLLKLSTKIK